MNGFDEALIKVKEEVYLLPRSEYGTFINDYIRSFITPAVKGTNMDIQFIAEESLALAYYVYVTRYITKAKRNMQDI